MFESLDERIEQDEAREIPKKTRLLHYLAISAISMIVVGGIAAVFESLK